MEISLLGYDQTLKLPSVQQLNDALSRLKGAPVGTQDEIWGIDSASIQSLINLDPFVGPQGQFVQLDPGRFVLAHKTDGTDALFQIGGPDVVGSVTHQVQGGDSHATAMTNSTLEVDKPGFLSFLGLGEMEEKTVQYNFSKSISSGYTVGQTLTGQFTLHGDGKNDHYKCAVYFDNVFGTFAFRDFSRDLDNNTTLGGTLVGLPNRLSGNVEVRLNTGMQTFTTTTDQNGKFNFTLPKNQQHRELTLSSDKASLKVQFQGASINNVQLVGH